MTKSLVAAPADARIAGLIERVAASGDTPYEDAPPPRDGVTMGDLLASLWRRKLLFVISFALLMCLCVHLILGLTPRYTSDAMLMIDPTKTHITDLQAVQDSAGAVSDLNFVRSEMQILTSSELARQVIVALDLVHNPEFADHPGFWQLWIKPLLGRFGLSKPAGPPPTPDQQIAATLVNYGARLSAYNDARSYIIDIGFSATDPALAQRILSKHIALFLDDQRAAKQLVIRKAEAWFATQLDQLQAKLQEEEKAQQAFRMNNQLLRTGGETVVGRQLADLTGQLAVARVDLERKDARFRQLSALLATHGDLADADTSLVSDDLLQHLRENETAAAQTLSQLRTRLGDGHPQVVAARANLAEVQARIAGELARLVASAQADATIARDNTQRLEQSVQSLEKQVGAASLSDLTADQMSRETDAERRLYDDLLARSKQVAIQRETQEPDARVVSDASLPLQPSSPHVGILGLLALTGSGLVAGVIAIARDLLGGRRVRTLSDAEAEIGFPGLAILPRFKLSRREGKIALNPRTTMAASLGVLRNSILFRCPPGKPIAVVMASAMAGDGKTVVSTLLAKSLAASGKRVLLIDADLHHSGLSRLLALRPRTGLTDILRGAAALPDCVVRDADNEMDVLTAGGMADDPFSIVLQDRVQALLEAARKSYDVVVIDTPPIAAVDDALVFSSLADATVVVVRWAKTPSGVVGGAVRRLRLAGANVIGTVINGTVASKYQQRDLESFRLSSRYFLQKS
jgi:capsular exopolysaccharide synthesis family protein